MSRAAAVLSNGETNSAPFPVAFEKRRVWLGLFLIALSIRLVFVVVGLNNGTDAWARYQLSLLWLEHPSRLPSDIWLPLHFWLLGAALKIWNSEWSVRLLTALLGALTVLPYAAVLRRVFEPRVAFYSSLLFALFGFHIAYSITTSSEVPTIFFLVVGIYCWLRFRDSGKWGWIFPAALAFSAASLCRFEAWLFAPVLGFSLLDFSRGWASLWSNRSAWLRMLTFTLLASAGSITWTIFSWMAWGDPLAFPHRTVMENLQGLQVLRHSLIYRVAVVPGALFVSLSPFIIALAVLGLVLVLLARQALPSSLACLGLALFGIHYYNCLRYEATMARYTLIYSWLFIPYAFEGLRRLSEKWRWVRETQAYLGVITFVMVWQAGIVLGSYYGPPQIADRLAVISPTLPLPYEVRALIAWLKPNIRPTDAVVVDEFHYEAGDIVRQSGLALSRVFQIPDHPDPSVMNDQLTDFVRRQHPRFLICPPYGNLAKSWSINDPEEAIIARLGLRLHREWKGQYWRVFTIQYSCDGTPLEAQSKR